MTSVENVMELVVCLRCDRIAARQETADAEGRVWFKALKELFAGRNDVTVSPTNCLGGCECSGVPNGCCSVGLMGKGRYGYVMNQLDPAVDNPKIEEFLRRYAAREDGKLACSDDPDLKRHVATRLPPLES